MELPVFTALDIPRTKKFTEHCLRVLGGAEIVEIEALSLPVDLRRICGRALERWAKESRYILEEPKGIVVKTSRHPGILVGLQTRVVGGTIGTAAAA